MLTPTRAIREMSQDELWDFLTEAYNTTFEDITQEDCILILKAFKSYSQYTNLNEQQVEEALKAQRDGNL